MANKQLVFSEGEMRRTCLYRVHDLTTGDTMDVVQEFSKITVVSIIPITVNIPNFPTSPEWTGTVITVPQVGLADDAMYMLVSGSAA